MANPAPTMRELIEAGAHYGHKTKRWNPRMAPFIYGVRNGIHIIDLGKTMPMLRVALGAVRETVAQGGRVLFVGTKRQATDAVAEAAKRCGQHYINQRWLGGLLTNWKTIQSSIKRLRQVDEILAKEDTGFTKKELLSLTRERGKLEASLGGIKDMGGKPDLIFIIDTNKEELAIQEAQRLRIPIIAIVDTNCSTEGITYPVPANDDSTRAIRLYCQLISDAVLAGISQSMSASGADLGEQETAGEVITAPIVPVAEAKSEEPAEDAGKGGRGRRGAQGKKAPVVEVKKIRSKTTEE